MQYSVVIPVFNEEGNVEQLHIELTAVMKTLGSYELIFVDDGSVDGTFERLSALHKRDTHIRVIQLRKNFGQSAAMDAGLCAVQGKIIITLDGDLQNDPADIPRLLKKLNEGYDAVSGWRWKRKDPLEKRVFTLFARFFRRFVIADKLHDAGCSLKVYRRECFENFTLVGEMHRYIAELLQLQGFKIGEVKVHHRARKHGKTKYSLSRVVKGFLDLFLVWFWQKYMGRPLHLFGGAGLVLMLGGMGTGLYMMWQKIIHDINLSSHFLSIVSVFLVLIGVQLFVSGLMTDLLVRNYYQGRKRYTIRKTL